MKHGTQIRILCLSLFLLIMTASVVLASGDSQHADSGVLIKDFLWRCLNFAVTLGLLLYFVTKPLKNGLKGRSEGIARELVNRIQNLRKESGFEVTDKIDIKIQKDGYVEDAVASNIKYIKNETLTAELEFEEQ